MTKAKSIFILGMRYTQRNLANEIISSLCSQRVLYTYEYEVGVIMMNFVLQRRLLSSASSSRTATFHLDRRAHLSGSPWGCWPPGHLSSWPADTLPPDSCRRSVPQLEDTRLQVGGDVCRWPSDGGGRILAVLDPRRWLNRIRLEYSRIPVSSGF